MATRSQKVKLGIFLTAAGALFAATVAVFAGLAFLSDEERYYVRFEESVTGLEVGAPVKLRGVQVGTVQDIELDPEDLERVRVTVSVDTDVRIPEDSRALLMMQGITGLRFVEIRGGSAEADPVPAGGTIPPGESVLTRLSGSAEDLALQGDRLLTNLLHLTDADNREQVAEVLERANATTARLEELLAELTGVAAQTHALLRENRPHIRRTLANVDRTSDEVATLAETTGEVVERVDPATLEGGIDGVTEALDSLGELIDRVTRILDHSQGEIRGTVYNLRIAAESFRELAESLQRQPSRLFFGGSPGERELP